MTKVSSPMSAVTPLEKADLRKVSEQILNSGLVTGMRIQHTDILTGKIDKEQTLTVEQALERDLCSVCGVFYVDPGKTYCSKKCSKMAHNFKRRMYNTRGVMHKMGFETKYYSGIQFTTTIPDEVKQFYPAQAHSFTFPIKFVNIDMMHPEHYFDEVGCCMGMVLGHYVNLLCRNPKFWGEDIKQTFFRMVKFVHDDPFNRFECGSCHIKFNKSAYGYHQQVNLCSNCVDRLPLF